MRLYHASTQMVREPKIVNRSPYLDFGTGFYITTNLTQAEDFTRKAFESARAVASQLGGFGRFVPAGSGARLLRRSGGAVMSKEMRFHVFAIEYYRQAKGLTGPEVAALFREKELSQYVLDNYFLYHIESPDLMVADIDRYVETGERPAL